MGSRLRTASWVLLTVLGGFVLLVSFVSANLGYRRDYLIGGVPLAASGREAVLTALRGILGTSAAYAAGFAVLFLATVLGPYRRARPAHGGPSWRPCSPSSSSRWPVVTLARIPTLGPR